MTALLLALLCATAWGQDTIQAKQPEGMWIKGSIPTGAFIDSMDVSSINGVKMPPDSLCATCGDTCRVVEVYHQGSGDIHFYPKYERRCPQHGRHVEWISETWRAKADSIAAMSALNGNPIEPWFPQYGFCDTKQGCVELGLREDGVVVYRRKP